MNAMPKIIDSVIGPSDEFEKSLREKVEAAREFVRAGEELLRTMHSKPTMLRPHDPERYAKLLPWPAMTVLFTDVKRALTEEEIIEELADGHVLTGAQEQSHKTRAENVKRSIAANVNNGNLKRLNDKIGLAEWDESFFS